MPATASLPPVVDTSATATHMPCPAGPRSVARRGESGAGCIKWAFTDTHNQSTSVWVADAPVVGPKRGGQLGTTHTRIVLQQVISATGTAEVFIAADQFGEGAASSAMFALPNCSFAPPGQFDTTDPFV